MLLARLYMLRSMIQLQAWDFIKKVLFNIVVVSIFASVIPIVLYTYSKVSFVFLCINMMVCFITTLFSIYCVGFSSNERIFVKEKAKQVLIKLKK